MSRLRARWFSVAMAVGCGADLLPGERVLDVEIPAIRVDGAEGSELGAAVLMGDGAVFALAPGAGQLAAYSADGDARWSAFAEVGGRGSLHWVDAGPALWDARAGVRVFDSATGDLRGQELPPAGAVAGALCPDGRWITAMGAGGAAACTAHGALLLDCDGQVCAVTLDGVVVGTGQSGGGIGFFGGDACWGLPSLSVDGAAGEVRCASGGHWVGEEGDHLGVAIADGRAAGVFNKWRVPARAVVQDLSGGERWSVEDASERSQLTLSHRDGRWVVGVPGALGSRAGAGRLFIVREQDL